ncbi:MAG: hypothetical protein WCR40_00490 [Candidatus Paceibacterota bacterium]
MDEETKQLIAEQMQVIPEDLRKAITSVDYPKKLQTIFTKNKLLIDQASNLETETTLTLLGLEPLTDYIDNLARELSIDRNRAVEIASDVDELIFQNVRESLKKISEETPEDESDQEEPNRDEIMSGIEEPSTIKENSVSVSSLKSNSGEEDHVETFSKGVEVKKEISSEIPKTSILPPKPLIKLENKPLHENTSPIENIVEIKTKEEVVIPKETVIVEEKTKLPEKEKPSGDPYREPII